MIDDELGMRKEKAKTKDDIEGRDLERQNVNMPWSEIRHTERRTASVGHLLCLSREKNLGARDLGQGRND